MSFLEQVKRFDKSTLQGTENHLRTLGDFPFHAIGVAAATPTKFSEHDMDTRHARQLLGRTASISRRWSEIERCNTLKVSLCQYDEREGAPRYCKHFSKTFDECVVLKCRERGREFNRDCLLICEVYQEEHPA